MMLYLIRHGRSRANEAGLVTGTPADVLSEEGLAQGARMAAWLLGTGIVADRYVVSPWKRASQTAELLVPHARWEVDARLGETNAGEVADWPRERFVAAEPHFYDHPANRYPAGESHLELNERVLGWLREQLEERYERLMVVAHSGPISCVLQQVMGIGMDLFPAFLPAHASLSIVDVQLQDGEPKGRLLGFSLGPASNLAVAIRGTSRQVAP
ncbi:histidine phosphatase family protein [Burkholderia multivorans]|uniref:histidine phosphatase family protein n=1 Tax=Burkholderia multivorans TaxID=87883 RepID=UPI0021BFA281|nr:histidine phosphatase family protein [Burkholderia multivorans]MDN7961060.1 histidine phosphatase family protein [Burkholderia multivorans]MDR8763859.1 putative phosphoserine phosphatase 2 [Burkholderia multivorans]MDR8769606.1 putative phosphoserine phosphatase 2 [Burkholderia multivorans]MDR8775256.1 putative phosphoserine phosphatase 2 [Burkholderia multivorans]MDR8793565.1 putative phosphoserine phosphatase 2 [Burkholderia multivorans]